MLYLISDAMLIPRHFMRREIFLRRCGPYFEAWHQIMAEFNEYYVRRTVPKPCAPAHRPGRRASFPMHRRRQSAPAREMSARVGAKKSNVGAKLRLLLCAIRRAFH